MKKTKVLLTASLVIIFMFIVGGCNGVWTNAEYATLIDQSAAMSKEASTRAVAGTMTCDEMKVALTLQAETWQKFKNAKDGVK